MNILIKLICLSILFLTVQTGIAQKTGKKELDQDLKQLRKIGNKFNWESQSQSKEASVTMDSIHLSGTWKAYNGLFNFNGMIHSMNLFKPFIIQINGKSISRSEDSPFVPFEIIDNKILVKGDEKEEGFINLLTDNVIVISWKKEANYTRYYYERE